jgi:hypothetical protein
MRTVSSRDMGDHHSLRTPVAIKARSRSRRFGGRSGLTATLVEGPGVHPRRDRRNRSAAACVETVATWFYFRMRSDQVAFRYFR